MPFGIHHLGGRTVLKKIAICCLAAALLTSTLKPASAAFVPATPASTSGTSLGVGGGIAVGVIATAFFFAVYDIWLKANGLKNWDGTPKKVVQAHHHH